MSQLALTGFICSSLLQFPVMVQDCVHSLNRLQWY